MAEFEKDRKILCFLCNKEMDSKDFEKILEKDYEVYKKDKEIREIEMEKKMEADKGIVECKGCGFKSHISKFPLNHSCLCESCFPKHLHKKRCEFCDTRFSSTLLKTSKLICSKCNNFLQLPLIIYHSDHALCSDCEKQCLDYNSCIVCKKNLSSYEEQSLSEKYYDSCFSCKNFFPSNVISIRKCGCLLCDNCMSQSLNFNSGCCLLCGERLLTPKKRCEICTESFKRDEMLTLTCDHYFCSDCLSHYLVSKISQGAEQIKCPSCVDIIDGNIIQSIVSSSL